MHSFSKRDLDEGHELLKEKRVESPIFSEGTYQVEVKSLKKPFFPFLQLSDEGEVLDGFCTCESAEKKGSCPHLAAAWLKIVKEQPLHVRFRESFWNQIGLICADRHGYEVRSLKVAGGGYEAHSMEGEILFKIEGKTPQTKQKLEELVLERPLETEETSLKFSNLSSEELELWREGRPSDRLSYELSLWADLAKWWMQLQEEGADYTLRFSKEAPPKLLTVEMEGLFFEFSIDLDHWPQLIPALENVDSPLEVHPYLLGTLKSIAFNREEGTLSIDFEGKGEMPKLSEIKQHGVRVGEWFYYREKGFYPHDFDPLLSKPKIEKEEVDLFFSSHLKLCQAHLTEPIHVHPIPIYYTLCFDEQYRLIVRGYLFKEGDLQREGAHSFGQWAYLPDQGFYLLEKQRFEKAEVVIEKEGVSEFINRHRVWLNDFEGFQIHVSGVESHLSYELNHSLSFKTRLEFTEEKEHIIDLGDWIYVEGKGFYSKVPTRAGAVIKAGLRVEREQLSAFIDRNRDDLESIPGFFAHRCPLEKSGLNIGFNEEGKIVITPEFFFYRDYPPEKVEILGDYTFVQGEGFSLIPHAARLPENYKKEKVIDALAEPYFVSYELDLLYPHVLKIDPKLERPKRIHVRLLSLKREPTAKTGQWVLELMYETNLGEVSPHTIWSAMWEGSQHLFSEAGLLALRSKRFDWLRLKNKKRWLKKGRALRLTTLEFLRLLAFEELLEPKGEGKKAKETKKLLHDFLSFKAPTEINTEGLKSTLRPYQQTGASWLWFLYSYGLSGLLADEMGLGKTHQAMALIAGVKNASGSKGAKFLVVCPTSVIYHWEKLIETFLPSVKHYVFHGVGRNFETFSRGSYDLLLTSYGITRTENKALSNYDFDVAIFDELQVAKNEKSLTNKALRKIHATMRLGLSGTPIENRLLELKALFDLVVPTYLPPLSVFRELFVNPIEKRNDLEKRELLARLIRPFMLRRKKSEVLLELPEKIEEVALCDLSEEQDTLYKGIVRESREALLRELEDSSKPPPIAHIFSMLSKLKQVCDHPSLITKDKKAYKQHSSGKWDLFLELLAETRDSGQKLVVFSQYLDMLDILGMHLKEEGIHFAEVRGATRDRKGEVERFATDPNCTVFLGSLQAAGVGIDLISASVVIHYDRWWNPAKENQATDRVHRMGQKRGVQVFKLVTKNTIEEHIHHLIESKLSLAKGVIGFDDQDQIKGLDRHELIRLLQMLEH